MEDSIGKDLRCDPSGWMVRWDAARAKAFISSGMWRNLTMADLAREAVRQDPERVILIENAEAMSAGELWKHARKLAAALLARGLRPGDRISYQLPNWRESIVIDLAATLAGLVVNPLVPIYRQAEVRYMLDDCGSRMIFVPAKFRRFDYRAMMRGLLPNLASCTEVVVLRGDAEEFTDYEALLASGDESSQFPNVDPNAIKVVLYTSGTTGRPKGVLHSHNTVDAQGRHFAKYGRFVASDRVLVASPVAHITGAILAFQLPWIVGSSAVLMDVWNGDAAVDLMLREKCTVMSGATPFLRDLHLAAVEREERLPEMRVFLCGGAAISAEFIRLAADHFGNCAFLRCYGCTEVPMTTSGTADRAAQDLNAESDGRSALCDLKLVDPDTGGAVPWGHEGEVLMRGPQMMLGYLHEEDNQQAFDAEGYFRTGDLARYIQDDWIVISGRKKDIIIRLGENLSPREIEEALLAHPAIAEIAVVGMPSGKTGEAACAFVVAAHGMKLTLSDISNFLVESGLAKQKIPERLELVDELPKTASGKVKKHVLRDRAREWAV